MKEKPKIIVVMPAYNAEKTLIKTYNAIPTKIVDKVIVVDDGSHDKTTSIAKSLNLHTIIHPQNRGYGGNQKTCYTMALNEGADIIVMIHPDYQYDPRYLLDLIRPIIEGKFDVMLGSRIRTRKEALDGGMPLYKYLGNRLLTIIENVALGLNLTEYHTGFRAFKGNVLKKIPFHRFSDDFVFDQEILIAAAKKDFRIGETPVPVRYSFDSSSIDFLGSVKYGLGTLWTLLKSI